MIYLIIAHNAEAEPIIQRYKLKRIYLFAYTVFVNNDIKLIICKMGVDNALMATSALLGYFLPTKYDLLINIGLCAASQTAIGEVLLIHKITYQNHSYFPDILFEHSLIESNLITY